jgi:hypothetical protein
MGKHGLTPEKRFKPPFSNTSKPAHATACRSTQQAKNYRQGLPLVSDTKKRQSKPSKAKPSKAKKTQQGRVNF